eukprot:gnl/Hemi2/26369_TR8851_c0_g1_i1.p1 gnl/Hemi2/26369_TR8851_c0_g1~~gnl/Hemi2/26369_TR8851_c0_g1_i1.p1  ORF type:complete len:363 (-),score=88.46 gnl/Hemi2/26369_TR8851_c0_g1_i1:171-1259(-)
MCRHSSRRAVWLLGVGLLLLSICAQGFELSAEDVAAVKAVLSAARSGSEDNKGDKDADGLPVGVRAIGPREGSRSEAMLVAFPPALALSYFMPEGVYVVMRGDAERAPSIIGQLVCLQFFFPTDATQPAELVANYPHNLDTCQVTGTFVVHLFLRLAKELGYEAGSLVDDSTVHCDSTHQFSLRNVRLIATGSSWYQRFGFEPQARSDKAEQALRAIQAIPLTQLVEDFAPLSKPVFDVLTRYLGTDQDPKLNVNQQLLRAEGYSLKDLMADLLKDSQTPGEGRQQACLDLVVLDSNVVVSYTGGTSKADKQLRQTARERAVQLSSLCPKTTADSTESRCCQQHARYMALLGQWKTLLNPAI